MNILTINDEVLRAFPSQKTLILGPVAIRHDDPNILSKTRYLAERFSSNIASGTNLVAPPAIQHWRSMFTKMGASPKYSSSVDSLFTYFLEHRCLYSISPIVDLYNWVSLTHFTPMACYNVDAIKGNLVLRHAAKGETFTPLGNPRQVEKTKNNEVVYADDVKIVCRYWNYRDCHETRITADTHTVIFIADLTEADWANAESQAMSIKETLEDALGVPLPFSLI